MHSFLRSFIAYYILTIGTEEINKNIFSFSINKVKHRLNSVIFDKIDVLVLWGKAKKCNIYQLKQVAN